MNEQQHEILIRLDENVKVLVSGQADQEVRIRKLERFRNWAAGVLAFAGAALGFKINPL
ncbi:MAG: hypothetical protein V3S01_13280 [Dehalococcoidia bacterium]